MEDRYIFFAFSGKIIYYRVFFSVKAANMFVENFSLGWEDFAPEDVREAFLMLYLEENGEILREELWRYPASS